MICFIALFVFSILGIFSASHRKIALKAFDCVFRRMTLRPCQSGLDRQLKTSIVGFVSRKNVSAARVIVKYFEIISWAFTLIMVLSLIFSIRGLYFYAVYGNCNGQNSDEFCVFDALNPRQATTCGDPSIMGNITKTPDIDNDPFIGPKDAKVTIIEFGCFSCPYSKKAEPVIKEILNKYVGRVLFVYRDFHIPSHPDSKERAIAAECANEQGKYWEYHSALFENQEKIVNASSLINLADEIGLNNEKFKTCLETEKYAEEVDNDFEDGRAAGVYGTPTFFINNITVVGPKPFIYFKNIIEKELKG